MTGKKNFIKKIERRLAKILIWVLRWLNGDCTWNYDVAKQDFCNKSYYELSKIMIMGRPVEAAEMSFNTHKENYICGTINDVYKDTYFLQVGDEEIAVKPIAWRKK